MITLYNLDFCEIEVYKDYVVSKVQEGTTMTTENLKVMAKLIDFHYKNKPFVYISHRIHSFSVNPMIHIESSKIQNLIGVAVVSTDPLQRIQTEIEKTFFEKEFQHFDTMKEALEWKDQIIKNKID